MESNMKHILFYF